MPAAGGPYRPLADVVADDIEEKRRPGVGDGRADLRWVCSTTTPARMRNSQSKRSEHGIEGECPAHAAVAEQEHAEAAAEIVAAMARMGCGGLHHTPSPAVLPAAPLPFGGVRLHRQRVLSEDRIRAPPHPLRRCRPAARAAGRRPARELAVAAAVRVRRHRSRRCPASTVARKRSKPRLLASWQSAWNS